MSGGVVLTRSDGPIAYVTIDRPEKRNALNSEVRRELLLALDRLESDPAVRVIVITGAGDRAFVAGADIGEFAERGPLEQREAMEALPLFDRLAACPKPTIAMINGLALGGGCELALACDIRIASDAARLGQPEINLGLIPGGGGTQRLARLIGTGGAMRLILTGDVIGAEESLRLGLVDLVLPDAELEDGTRRLAETIASRSPLALRLAKEAIRAASESPMAAGLALERDLFLVAFGSHDRKEGVNAFLEKRTPHFTGT
jgi:enoyl-CoA hydratase